MPLFYQQDINLTTKLGIWEIGEEESFFLAKVPLQREITHPHKRLQHLSARYLLLCLFPDFPYEEILIADTRKPYLPDEQYHFSISHCGNYGAAIVSSSERVGIDIELVTPRVEKIKHKFLHADELAFVKKHPAEDHIRLLTLLWSMKESMFKWWGRGEVDFSEMLRIEPFTLSAYGQAQVFFYDAANTIPLQMHYRVMGDLCLSWVSGSAHS